jgi:hypothetical protein
MPPTTRVEHVQGRRAGKGLVAMDKRRLACDRRAEREAFHNQPKEDDDGEGEG